MPLSETELSLTVPFIWCKSWVPMVHLSLCLCPWLLHCNYCWYLMIVSKNLPRNIFIWQIGRHWRLLAIGVLAWILWLSLYVALAFIWFIFILLILVACSKVLGKIDFYPTFLSCGLHPIGKIFSTLNS